MLRTLRAFAWLRWRMLVNSLERTGSRDTLERFSIAIQKLGPIMAGILMIPSALALAVIGAAAGYALARGQVAPMLFDAGRYILLGVLALSIVGPLMLPAADRTNPVRLLLLPISRRTMYVAQSSAALGDPWVLLTIPLVLGIGLGLAAGGAVVASGLALVAGALLVLAVIGVTSLATSLLHLAVRDRRRGELLALLFILVIPAISLLPGLLGGTRSERQQQDGRPAAHRPAAPPWVGVAVRRAGAALPSELYVAATRSAARRAPLESGAAIAALVAATAVVHGLGFMAFGRILDAPGSTGARRAASSRTWNGALLGLSPGTSAVALAHLRLGLRTPRGRSTMLSPLIMLGVFAALMFRTGSMRFGVFSFENGLGLACFTSFVALVSILPIGMNQFAVDRAGFTMAMLSPLDDREYLDGKAIGNALIVAPGALVCLLGPMIAFPGGPPAMWVSLALSLLAVALVVAPAAAMLSAVFPRAVDLNSIGRASNAHGLAGLLGLASFVAAAAPCVLVVLAATRLLHRPSLAPVLLLIWLAMAFGLNRLLSVPARRLFSARRENLAIIAFQKSL